MSKNQESLSRVERMNKRMANMVDKSKRYGICERCGRKFEQMYRDKKNAWTTFKMCPECRMATARGYSNAKIPYVPHINQVKIHESKARFKVIAAGVINSSPCL